MQSVPPLKCRLVEVSDDFSAGSGDHTPSRAVIKALEILEFLGRREEPMPLKDIAERAKISRTSTFRLLRTLEKAGYLKPRDFGWYQLAPRGISVSSTLWLARMIRVGLPWLRCLNQELGESVSAAALFENRIEVVAAIESPQTIRMSNNVGRILAPNATALGKAITAFQSPDQTERLLRSFGIYRYTLSTITDQNELLREFKVVRSQGYATDREESTEGGFCLAVPITNQSSGVFAAISLSLPKLRLWKPEQEIEILAAIRNTVRHIKAEL